METYNVIISPTAKASIEEIADYIYGVLQSPEAAENTVHAILKAVMDLDFMPERYAALPEDFMMKNGVRRMQVKNFFVYYAVDEEEKSVNILDVLYVGREQRDHLDTI